MSRAKFKLISNISVSDVLLDKSNPRIRTGGDQADCIEKVLRKEAQLMTLLKDIAENGLTTMPVLLMPAPEDPGMYIVKDGNRRVTALKLLNEPDICADIRLKKQIQSIKDKHKDNITDKLDCYVSSDEDAIAREVLARHSGAMGGAGQLDWSAYLRTVFLLNSGHPAEYKRVGQYLSWAEEKGTYVDDEFPITTLQRFFSRENLKLLGFNIENDELVPNMAENTVLKIANAIIYDFGIAKKNVSTVFDSKLAAAYIQDLRAAAGLALSELQPKPTPPSNEGMAKTPTPTNGASSINPENSGLDTEPITPQGNSESNEPLAEAAPPPKNTRPPSKPSWDRKKLFWRGSPAPSVLITEAKAKMILFEIGKIPKTQDMSLATAMLLRALIELSIGYYQKTHSIKDQGKLAKNVVSVADSLLNRNVIDQSLVDLIKAYANTDKGQVSIFNIDTIQKYIHRDTHLPGHVTLHTMWDEIGPLIRACWSN